MAGVLDKIKNPLGRDRNSDYERDDRGDRFARQNRWDRNYDDRVNNRGPYSGPGPYQYDNRSQQYGRTFDSSFERSHVDRHHDSRSHSNSYYRGEPGYTTTLYESSSPRSYDRTYDRNVDRDGYGYRSFPDATTTTTTTSSSSRTNTLGSGSTFEPVVDLSETEREWHVHAELPGLDKNSVHVTCDAGRLTISGERPRSSKEGDNSRLYHRTERAYGSFSRTLTLPAHVDTKDIKAQFSNGVLEVTIPKPADYTQRQLDKRVTIS